MALQTIDTLKSLGNDFIDRLVSRLNKFGIVSDEEQTGIGSEMVHGWDLECDVLLRGRGYTGGELKKIGKYVQGYGAVYAIYDSDRITYENAKGHLNQLELQATD